MSQSVIAVMRWTVPGVTWTASPSFISRLTSSSAFLDLEQHPSGPEEDRLVLLVVVLQAERVAGVDVNQLADVAIGLRPVQLVAPRLVHSCHVLCHVCSFLPVLARERSMSPGGSLTRPELRLRRPAARASACSTSAAVARPAAPGRAALRARRAALQAAQHLLGERNRGRRHAELAQARGRPAAQQRRVGGHLAADGDRDAGRAARRARPGAACAGSPGAAARTGSTRDRRCDRRPDNTGSDRWCRC